MAMVLIIPVVFEYVWALAVLAHFILLCVSGWGLVCLSPGLPSGLLALHTGHLRLFRFACRQLGFIVTDKLSCKL